MPFMTGGDLTKLMTKCDDSKTCHCNNVRARSGGKHRCWEALGEPYSLSYVLALFHQAIQGLDELHAEGLVHMDIKPLNIMPLCSPQPKASPQVDCAKNYNLWGLGSSKHHEFHFFSGHLGWNSLFQVGTLGF